ncbi:MAG: hypothetical protein J5606_07220 [Bacteroidales bacterium]|nr:hypothetical protein [Bacteroidales bacterium]
MEIVWEIIKITLPAVIVACTAYMVLKMNIEKELRQQVLDLKNEGKKVMNPIRIQAYERLALFLERTRPENLILRTSAANLTATQYRTLLLTNIRNEFEHNLSQQVYVSGALWQMTKKAKEDTVKLINLAGGQLPIDATATDLATRILELLVEQNPQPADVALDFLRKEITELY